MPRRQNRNQRPTGCASSCCGIYFIVLCVLSIFGAIFRTKQTLLKEKELLSSITENTPISGFYGPGAWWVLLITLGMTHGHTLTSLVNAEEESPPEWDYDLIGASAYVVAAAIDLMHKGRLVAQLGDNASESTLLPALLCAERVVAVGTGSSLFSIATAAYRGRSVFRTVAVAIIPLIFALIASGFSASAHQAIQKTVPVLWCRLHDGSELGKYDVTPLTLPDFPAMVFIGISYLPSVWWAHAFWRTAAASSCMGSIVAFVGSLWGRKGLRVACGSALGAGLVVALFFCLFPLIAAPFVIMGAIKWFFTWVVFWWPIYILAWFPQMGFFPLTAMSVLDMDQIAALLGIVVVAAIRMLRPVCEARRLGSRLGRASAHELAPLLPVSRPSDQLKADEEVNVITHEGTPGAASDRGDDV
ncbi:hypothetical protein GGX14DRAFT_564374 [Mycena pura]|uniref:Transmembrane protein n=1 Tax=Mycena pura TaxID=153505 RepID=A0AAD6VKR0_9AGAR|nr:hypothetical protein GGX14DRAFT_564374 [Mycena pura]